MARGLLCNSIHLLGKGPRKALSQMMDGSDLEEPGRNKASPRNKPRWRFVLSQPFLNEWLRCYVSETRGLVAVYAVKPNMRRVLLAKTSAVSPPEPVEPPPNVILQKFSRASQRHCGGIFE